MVIAAYAALLLAWLLFLPPLLRGRGSERTFAGVAVAIGLLAGVRELWMTFVWGPSAVGPIRLDIPLLSLLLCLVYGITAARLWISGWARLALVAGGVTLAAGGGMAAAWIEAGRESERLARLYWEGRGLLFEAKFAHQDAYRGHFEMTGAASEAPAGHWEATPGTPYTRLVVNPAGRAFLFHHCGETECQFGPGGELTRAPGSAGAAGDGTWNGRLVWRGVGERALATDTGPAQAGSLLVTIDELPVHFRRAPPPLRDRREPERLAYLGAFSALEPVRAHARVSQLWLWRDGEALLGIGIFRTLVAGQRAEFVAPVVLGRAEREGAGWRFRFEEDGRPHEALVRLEDEGAVALELTGGGRPWPAQRLAPEALFRDEVMELAPRSGEEAWRHWFDTLLTGHFSSAQIPAS